MRKEPILKEAYSCLSTRVPYAFKNLMIHGMLQFALLIALRYALHRCENQDIHCQESCKRLVWIESSKKTISIHTKLYTKQVIGNHISTFRIYICLCCNTHTYTSLKGNKNNTSKRGANTNTRFRIYMGLHTTS